ncbi:hypothetical protein AHiyo6_00510 [Arthrobacter sp. Hiyo6]|nr:hypothetical protein AHiyo6_00510 [Arthrobacter sp. Hiyo6]
MQARKVAFYQTVTRVVQGSDLGPAGFTNIVALHNLSDEAIYKVLMYDENGIVWTQPNLPAAEIVLPGKDIPWSAFGPKAHIAVTFTDNSGQGWLRDSRGRLHPISRWGNVSSWPRRLARKILSWL